MTNLIIGVSLPEGLIQKIDEDRGDISRSRFLQRLVEQAYDIKNTPHRSQESVLLRTETGNHQALPLPQLASDLYILEKSKKIMHDLEDIIRIAGSHERSNVRKTAQGEEQSSQKDEIQR
jgi:hypothetical protein